MKKWLLVFVFLLSAFCACAGVLAEAVVPPESPMEDFAYSIADNEVTILKYRGNDAVVVVPSSIEGLPVTAIGEKAFSYTEKILEVHLPDTLRSIYNNAFYCCMGMTTITLPEGLESIGQAAFYQCKLLQEVTLPQSLHSMGQGAFSESGLASIKIPSSLTSIPTKCFEKTQLSEVTIPAHVLSIGQHAFTGTPLKSLTIQNPATTIQFYAFSDCTELVHCNLPADVQQVKGGAFNNTPWENQALSHVISQAVTSGMSDFEKALALHDWLIYHADYDPYYSVNTDWGIHDAFGVLSMGRGVCESYARAYELLLNRVGIENHYVIGTANGESHSWNLIKLDGEWYHVDCTWDDPTGGGNERHTYFGLDDNRMRQDHAWSGTSGLPLASGTRYLFGVDHALYADFRYTFNDYDVTITGYTGSDPVVRIPSKIAGYPVTAIGYGAFCDHTNITEVHLPQNLRTIGKHAFESCTNLQAVYGTENVTVYEDSAFNHCTSLSTLAINTLYIERIGVGAFYGTQIDDIIFMPSSKVPDNAAGDSKLCIILYDKTSTGDGMQIKSAEHTTVEKSITIPAYLDSYPVTVIGQNAFHGFTNLVEVYLPETVTRIENEAFSACTKLHSVHGASNVVRYGKRALANCTSLENIDIFSTPLEFVDEDAFSCTNIRGVLFGSYGVVNNTACYGSPMMIISYTLSPDERTARIYSNWTNYDGVIAEVITIPEYLGGYLVTSIFENALSRLTCSELYLPSGLTSIGAFGLSNCPNLHTIHGAENVTSYGDRALEGCSALRSIQLSDHLSYIGQQAFSGTQVTGMVVSAQHKFDSIALEKSQMIHLVYNPNSDGTATIVSATIPESGVTDLTVPQTVEGYTVTAIGTSTFENKPTLKTITLPTTVTHVENRAFAFNEGLTAIHGTEGLVSIGDNAFDSCKSLKTLSLGDKLCWIGSSPFRDTPLKMTLLIDASNPDYRMDYYCVSESPVIAFCFGTAEDGSATLVKCYADARADLTHLVVPASYKGRAVTAVEKSAFANLSTLKEITLPSSVRSIGSTAFQYCSELVAVHGTENVTSYGEYAFSECTKLTSMVINDNVTAVGSYAFDNTQVSKELYIPDMYQDTTVNDSAFSNSKITALFYSVTDEDTVTITGTPYLSDPVAITIPESIAGYPVTAIGDYVFYMEQKITEVHLPASLRVIGAHAFGGCNNLTGTIDITGITLGYLAFYNSPGVTLVGEPAATPTPTPSPTPAPSPTPTATPVPTPTPTPVPPETPFKYSITNDGVKITAYTGQDAHIVIPDTYEGLPVTVIGNSVFDGNLTLETITLPLTVHSIEYRAFAGCKNLTAVYGADNVTSYADSAFAGCTKLTDIHISPNFTQMQSGAFKGCPLPAQVFLFPADSPLRNNSRYGESITMFFFEVQNGEAILAGATHGADDSALVELHVPAAYQGLPVTEVGSNAFNSNSWLSAIYLPDTVHTIGMQAFVFCQNLTAVYGADNVTSYGNFAFSGCTKLTDITISPNITQIEYGAFQDCPLPAQVFLCPADSPLLNSYGYGKSLSMYFFEVYNGAAILSKAHCGSEGSWQAIVPATYQGVPVTTIGTQAFYYQNTMTDVQLPASIKYIDDYAFADCISLTSTINVDGVTLGDGAFNNCPGVTLVGTPVPKAFLYEVSNGEVTIISYTGNDAQVVIPADFKGQPVTAIGGSAFSRCQQITSVVIPEGVRVIDTWAFDSCSNLTEITLPSSLTEIRTYAFNGCTNLASITLPEGLHSIGNFAFCQCNSLSNIVIPDSVTSLGEGTFYDSGLKSIKIGSNITSIGAYTFGSCDFLEDITLPNGLVSIGQEAFYNCYTMTSLAIPNSVTTIGDEAFKYCFVLEHVTLPRSLKAIGNRAFEMCGMKNIVLPEGVETISEGAFSDCSDLMSITLPDSVKSIGANAFNNCYSLTFHCSRNSAAAAYASANGINVKYTDAPAIAFTYTISNGEVTITGYTGNDAHVVVPAVVEDLPVTAIGDSAFAGCTNLTTISTSGLVAIARDNVSAVTAVSLPASVTDIGNQAFAGCTALRNVELPSSLETIGEKAFSGIPGIDVTLPTNIQHIGASAFDGQPQTLPVMDCPTAFALASGQSGSLYKVQGKEEFLISANTDAQGQKTFSLEETSATGNVSIPEGITVISGGVQKQIDNGSITSMSIPDSVQEIEIQINPDNENFSIECSPDSAASSWATDNGVSWGCTQHVAQIMPGQAATCTNTGLTEGEQCAACGEILTAQTEIPALGHREGERTVVTEPTATTPGLAEYRCTVCGATLRTEDIPALGIARVAGDVDLDGDMNIFDALLILQYDVGWDVELELKNADVDADGDVNIFDALLILQYDVGWDVELL